MLFSWDFLIIYLIIFPKNKKLGRAFELGFLQPGHLHFIFHVSLKTVIYIQITLGCTGLCPAGFWLSSRMEILHHLWITCSSNYLHCEKVFSTVKSEFLLLQFVTIAASFFFFFVVHHCRELDSHLLCSRACNWRQQWDFCSDSSSEG